MTTVLIIISPEQFSEKELFTVKSELENAGHMTVLASISIGLCTSSRQSTITATQSLSEVRTADYDGVVFIGGRGSKTFFTNDDARRIAAEMSHANKIIAAICLAPVILANAGMLENKRATVAKTEVKTLKSKNAKYTGPGVMVDGNIITASGPGYSKKLAKAIIARLELTRLLGDSEQ
jgi:protease I